MLNKSQFNFVTIDILRGFAASMVFFYHYGINSVIKDKFHISYFNWIDLIGSTYAVPLFFLISGYCIHLSQLKRMQSGTTFNLMNYLRKRFWRIYPVYFIALLFSCTVMAINGQKINLNDFFIHLIVGQGLSIDSFNSINLVLWTITIEILFYLLYPLWYYLRARYDVNKALIISIGVSIISWIFITWNNNFTNPYFFWILNLWGAWCFGAWIAEKFSENLNFFYSKLWWISGILMLSLYLVLLHHKTFQLFNYSISIVLWAWPLSMLLILETRIKYQNILTNYIIKILSIIGLSSYSLYLLHEPLMLLRNNLLTSITDANTRILIGMVWIIITFFMAWCSYLLFEKPFLSYRSRHKHDTI